MNLGMSLNFGDIDLDHLPFPVHMRVDYIRVYQPVNAQNIGCDPPGFPTASYINESGYRLFLIYCVLTFLSQGTSTLTPIQISQRGGLIMANLSQRTDSLVNVNRLILHFLLCVYQYLGVLFWERRDLAHVSLALN